MTINDCFIAACKSNLRFSGSTSTITREINNEITSKNAYKIYTGRAVLAGRISSDSISNIKVNSIYPLVSFIRMIAPSPDWFIGVHDVDLCNTTTGEWVDSVVRNLFPYDAGTDSGKEFSSPNVITNPQQVIHLLTNNITGSFKGDQPIKRFGTFTFEKTPMVPTQIVKSCNGSANYTLQFQGEWTSERHPNFPRGLAHFSPIIGCSHNNGYVMWKAGIKATRGVQSIAETGMFELQSFSILLSEMN